MKAQGRRHYRAYQREAQQAKCEGMLVTNKKKHFVMAAFASMLMVVFLKGIVIGLLLGKR